MSILSGAIGTMKKKGVAFAQYQVPGTFNSKTYWVTGKSSEPNAGASGLQWKTTNTDSGLTKYTTAATANTDVNGLTNSNTINNATHPAAFYCRGLTLGGYTWFLPSAGELNHIYTNLSASGKLLDSNGTHPDKFTGSWYWSSSEYSDTGAWIQGMSYGGQVSYGKTNTYRVRAVRTE